MTTPALLHVAFFHKDDIKKQRFTFFWAVTYRRGEDNTWSGPFFRKMQAWVERNWEAGWQVRGYTPMTTRFEFLGIADEK